MEVGEAKRILAIHSFSDPENPLSETGFLGSLRPFTGLREENFRQVKEAIAALAPHLSQSSTVDRDVISALWSIVYLGTLWGVNPDGMLLSNGLLSSSDAQTLRRWINEIAYDVFALLDA